MDTESISSLHFFVFRLKRKSDCCCDLVRVPRSTSIILPSPIKFDDVHVEDTILTTVDYSSVRGACC